ncbi:MAG: U32 family peptidase [Calditrichaeota bacterium]|nr:MAG: U32 family peptidase [Calditrichota bacterium]
MIQKPELLMPAGNFEKMKYAYAFGADATYLGIPMFSLRARENGFKRETVIEAIRYAHNLGKKVYLTANILPHNHKVAPFIKYIGQLLEEAQPDAWIMSDPGIIMMMREHFPDQEIHLSVQANTVNYATAKFWEKAGIRRIILSRELTIREIKQIRDYCPDLELEAFVHGAICIAYSGRCLISNYMSYRDPNQGTCSHSCRWQYKMYKKEENQPANWREEAQTAGIEPAVTQQGDSYVPIRGDYYLEEVDRPGEYMQLDEDENGTYLMNARDLCAIEYLDELREAGVDSFKVEGRNKSVYYAALIARAYRRAIDDLAAGRPFNPENITDVFAAANKGYIAGFLKGNPGRSAQKYDGTRAEQPAYRFAGIVRDYDAARGWMKVEPRNPLRPGMELEMLTRDTTRTLKVEALYNIDGAPIDIIHGGLHYCYIPVSSPPEPFTILREKTAEDFAPEHVELSRGCVENANEPCGCNG